MSQHLVVTENDLLIVAKDGEVRLSYFFAEDLMPKEMLDFIGEINSDGDEEIALKVETPLRQILSNTVDAHKHGFPEEDGFKLGDVVMFSDCKPLFDTIRADLIYLLGEVDRIKYLESSNINAKTGSNQPEVNTETEHLND